MALKNRVGEGFLGGYGWKSDSDTDKDPSRTTSYVNQTGDGRLSPGFTYASDSQGLQREFTTGSLLNSITPSPVNATFKVGGSFFIKNTVGARAFRYDPTDSGIEISLFSKESSSPVPLGRHQFEVTNLAGDVYKITFSHDSGWQLLKNDVAQSLSGTNGVNKASGFNQHYFRVYRSGDDLKFVMAEQTRDIVTFIDVDVASGIDFMTFARPDLFYIANLTVWGADAAQITIWDGAFGTNDFRPMQNYIVLVDVRAAPDGNIAKTTNGTPDTWSGSATNAFDDQTDGNDATHSIPTTDELGFEMTQTYEEVAASVGLTIGKVTSEAMYLHRVTDDDAESNVIKLKNGVLQTEKAITLSSGTDGYAQAFFGEGESDFDNLNILPTTNGVIMTSRRADS